LLLSAVCFGVVAAQEKPKPTAAELRAQALKTYGDRVDVRLDQPYAGTDNPQQRIDLYLPKNPKSDKPLPILVHIHGGGWSGGDRSTYMGRCLSYAATGDYAAASVGYRLSGEVKWPAQIYDCKAAIRYLRAHAKELNIDPDRIGVTGASAGGHLVTLLGVSGGVKELEGNVGEFTSLPSTVTCVINFCGPQDMGAPLMQGEAAKVDDPAVSGLFGGPLAEHADAVKAASPLTYVSKSSVPIMTVHGTKDARVDFKHAERLDAAMKKAGATSILVPMVGAGHGIPVPPELIERMDAFWDKYLRDKNVEVAATPIQATPAK
jgi:acetyl esterase/lipase